MFLLPGFKKLFIVVVHLIFLKKKKKLHARNSSGEKKTNTKQKQDALGLLQLDYGQIYKRLFFFFNCKICRETESFHSQFEYSS